MLKKWDDCTINTKFTPRVFPGQEWLKSKYDDNGFDKDGYSKDRSLLPVTDPLKHYNIEGYDMDGYDKDGYDKDGNGFNSNGISKDGKYTCSGQNTIQLDESGNKIYDINGYDKDGFHRDTKFHRDKEHLPDTNKNKYYSNNGNRFGGDVF